MSTQLKNGHSQRAAPVKDTAKQMTVSLKETAGLAESVASSAEQLASSVNEMAASIDQVTSLRGAAGVGGYRDFISRWRADDHRGSD